MDNISGPNQWMKVLKKDNLILHKLPNLTKKEWGVAASMQMLGLFVFYYYIWSTPTLVEMLNYTPENFSPKNKGNEMYIVLNISEHASKILQLYWILCLMLFQKIAWILSSLFFAGTQQHPHLAFPPLFLHAAPNKLPQCPPQWKCAEINDSKEDSRN